MKPFHFNGYQLIERPGFFGSRRDELTREYTKKYGTYGKDWTLVWYFDNSISKGLMLYPSACRWYYEYSYYQYLKDKPTLVDHICSYGECIDNAITNIQSGYDYTIQEAYSTHIQDIAVRNVIRSLGRKFEGKKDEILVIRGEDTNGYYLNPGQIPFYDPSFIMIPSKAPKWAKEGSVEDFWQSNKFLALRESEIF